jgi:hypothetical protein
VAGRLGLEPGRLLVIVANDRGDQSMFPLLHELVRALVLQARAGPVVEFGGDAVEVVIGPRAQVGAFGEVLAEQAIGVFVGAALPGGWKPVIDAFAITFGDRWPGAETY